MKIASRNNNTNTVVEHAIENLTQHFSESAHFIDKYSLFHFSEKTNFIFTSRGEHTSHKKSTTNFSNQAQRFFNDMKRFTALIRRKKKTNLEGEHTKTKVSCPQISRPIENDQKIYKNYRPSSVTRLNEENNFFRKKMPSR